MLTGANFLNLWDEDIIKQMNEFDDSMGSWISNSIFLLNNRNGLQKSYNSALTSGLACLPISTQTSQIELVFQLMRTIGTWTDTLECARKHYDLFKPQEIERNAKTATFSSHINSRRAYAYSSRMGKTRPTISESYLREIEEFGLNSLNMKLELSNMVTYLENKTNTQMDDILEKMSRMMSEVTSMPTLTAEVN